MTPASFHRARSKAQAFIAVEPLPEGAGLAYGKFRTALEKAGQRHWRQRIAAHAAASLTLIANNEREFKRIKSLEVENWVG